MFNGIPCNTHLTDDEVRAFNVALMKMLLKSEEENKVLKEKLALLETLLKNSPNIPLIGKVD